MSCIAIIDDNLDQSETVRKNLVLDFKHLGSTLNVVTSFPFVEVDDYFTFINHNDVSVLILDEKLNDQGYDGHGPVNYTGSQLVGELRKQLKDFPIFSLTVIPDDDDLLANTGEYEDIISRTEFYENSARFAPKFIRAAKNYMNENSTAFEEFDKLAQKVSSGKFEPHELKRLKELQVKLELPFSGFDDRESWLKTYESQIHKLEEITSAIKQKLGGDELEEG